MINNSYLNDAFKKILSPEDEYGYYFYSMSFASAGEYLLYGGSAMLLNKHLIVCFTKKRIILAEVNPITGDLTENVSDISMKNVTEVIVKKGILKTKIKLLFPNGSKLEFKPNNICVGLSNHKKNLLKLVELYK
ncbi:MULTISPECIES: PH domain-containing protein [Clostridium]|uniref:PH domain-containing protein n=1 Tax=Clostridium TaxID=1485 RepID=UPI0008249DC1|nr:MULTISPECIES: PH domain-containing protein [Clostridium]PJI09040.1 hypothetical protein CUB90_14700 [Clostridium sp. CT7]